MRLAKLSDFRNAVFAPGSAPQMATLRRRIAEGKVPGGRQMAGYYYVDLDEWDRATGMRDGIAKRRADRAKNPLLAGLV